MKYYIASFCPNKKSIIWDKEKKANTLIPAEIIISIFLIQKAVLPIILEIIGYYFWYSFS
jgi:hypothetical protein